LSLGHTLAAVTVVIVASGHVVFIVTVAIADKVWLSAVTVWRRLIRACVSVRGKMRKRWRRTAKSRARITPNH
jgi:hypothetical protein